MHGDYRKKIKDITQQDCASSPSAQVLWTHIESLMNTIQIDKSLLIQKIEEVISGQSTDDKNFVKNILNSIMELFGLNVISKDLKNQIGNHQAAEMEQILDIDMPQAHRQATAITKCIVSLEDSCESSARRIYQLEALLSDANRTIDELRMERDKLLKEREVHDKDMLRTFQRILSHKPELKIGAEVESDPLLAYLDDLGITWSWDDKMNPDDFTVYRISDESKVGVVLPCLYRNDTVALRGLVYSIQP